MIKWLLSLLLILSCMLNIFMWIALTRADESGVEHLGLPVQNEQREFELGKNNARDAGAISDDSNAKLNVNSSDSNRGEVVNNVNQIEYMNEFKMASKSSDWDAMLETMELIYDETVENETENKQVDLLISQAWLEKLSLNKSNNNNDQWIEAMMRYIDRKPDDLNVGFFYLQYLIEAHQNEDALLYLNYLLQISTNQNQSDNLKMNFNQFVLQYLIELKNDNQLTAALNLLNVILQYEVLNIPLLIEKTQVQILIGDYQGAAQTLSQFEYDIDYQTQVESFKSQIENAPTDRSIKLLGFGGQFIVNTLFDDGYQENTIPLLIDTGASISVLNEAIFLQYVDSPNIQFIRNINVDTAGGNVPAKLYEIERIRIGEFEVLNTQFMVLPMALNKPYQGLLGMSFLRMFDFNIDQKSATLHLEN